MCKINESFENDWILCIKKIMKKDRKEFDGNNHMKDKWIL